MKWPERLWPVQFHPLTDDDIRVLKELAAACRQAALITANADHRQGLLTLSAQIEAKVAGLRKDAAKAALGSGPLPS